MDAIKKQAKAFCSELARMVNSGGRGTGAELARYCGYTHQMISNMKAGIRYPSIEHDIQVAWFFNKTLSEFMISATHGIAFGERRKRERWPNGMRKAVRNLKLVYSCNDQSTKNHTEEILQALARCSKDKAA